jgi:hypothetical protein
MNPSTIRAKYGPGLVTPTMMPRSNANLDDLPNGLEAAAAYLRGDSGKAAEYHAEDCSGDGQAARARSQSSSRDMESTIGPKPGLKVLPGQRSTFELDPDADQVGATATESAHYA